MEPNNNQIPLNQVPAARINKHNHMKITKTNRIQNLSKASLPNKAISSC